jgi:hypothetical protein
MTLRSTTLLVCLGSSGCLTLDSFVFSGIPCGEVGPDTCDPSGEVWDQVCLPCSEAYDWQQDYPWFPETLAPGQTIRPVDPDAVTDLTIQLSGGGEADAVFLAGHGPLADITILHNHGNFANLEHYAPRLRMLHEAGYSVFAWDYRGFGKTTPDTYPSPEEFMDDAMAARDAVDALAPDPDRIVLYGYSLGAVPAVEQALNRPGCALVLETPFPSLRNFAESSTALSIPDQLLGDGRYDNVHKIQDHDGPLLAMAGANDGLIPPPLVEELADANGGPTELWVVPGSEHGISTKGIPEVGLDAYFERLSDYLEGTPCRP